MGIGLSKRIKQKNFKSPQHEAVLNLLVAAGHVRAQLDRVCTQHHVTHGQYNVLRILRGAHPEGYPRCDIIERMLEAAPDVTRLIDRLIKVGLVERRRSPEDRRLSVAFITEKGLELLNEMEPDIMAVATDLGSSLSTEDCSRLSDLCEAVYDVDGVI